jgi:hypothetical protein
LVTLQSKANPGLDGAAGMKPDGFTPIIFERAKPIVRHFPTYLRPHYISRRMQTEGHGRYWSTLTPLF